MYSEIHYQISLLLRTLTLVSRKLTSISRVRTLCDWIVRNMLNTLFGRYLFLHPIIEAAHDLQDALIDVCRYHYVRHNVNIPFTDPGKWAFKAAVEVVDVKVVNSYA